MNIAEHNQQVMQEWSDARLYHYKTKGIACPNCQSYNLKAQKRLVDDKTKLVGICQECRNSELIIQPDDKFQDDCIFRGRLKLSEKR